MKTEATVPSAEVEHALVSKTAVLRTIASVRDTRSMSTDDGIYDLGAALASITLASARAAKLIEGLQREPLSPCRTGSSAPPTARARRPAS